MEFFSHEEIIRNVLYSIIFLYRSGYAPKRSLEAYSRMGSGHQPFILFLKIKIRFWKKGNFFSWRFIIRRTCILNKNSSRVHANLYCKG